MWQCRANILSLIAPGWTTKLKHGNPAISKPVAWALIQLGFNSVDLAWSRQPGTPSSLHRPPPNGEPRPVRHPELKLHIPA